MKKSTYRMALLTAIITLLSACQMENDLRSKKADEVGYLNATMLPQSTEPMLTRASGDTYDVNDFDVAVISTEDGDTVARFDSYRALKEQGDVVLATGSYRVIAWTGTDDDNVQTTPYFVGQKDFEVVAHRTTQVEATCKLGRVKVSTYVSEEFENAFEDDYTITFNNNYGVETLDASGIDQALYFKLHEGDKKIDVSVKATPKGTETTITKTFTLYKQDEEADDGSTLDLEAGDAFRINLTPSDDDSGNVVNPTEADFSITVDLKWNDRNEEVSLPINVVDVTSPDNGSSDNDDDNSADDTVSAPVLTPDINGEAIWNLHMEYDSSAILKVDIQASATIQQLVIGISSDNAGFMWLIGNLNLTEFDLCNITDATTESSVSGYLRLPYNDEVKGQTAFTFDVSSFSNSLSGFAGEHRFTLTVTDALGQQSAGTLTVTCEKDPTLSDDDEDDEEDDM